MKHIYLILLLFVVQNQAFAQYQIQVLDKLTQSPVKEASVYFPDTKTGTMTNENGIFLVHSKINSLFLQISALNYKTFLGTIKLQSDTLSIFLEPSFHNLQEITVSGNSSRLQGENVINVESIHLEDNPLLQGTSLTQKLTGVAGVSNFSTGTGIGKPMIRGMTGNRIAVFSQGIRMENQQWGDEHGLGLDENGYEQVEIIKGPASLLYGSDALGGVLYFVGERYAKENSMDASIHSEYNTNTEGWRNTGSFKISKGKFHWNLFGGNTTHQDYKDGNGNFVPNSRFHTTDLKTALGYTTDKFSSSLKYNYLNEVYGLTEIEETENPDGYKNGRTPAVPYQGLVTHLVSSENTFFFNNDSKLKVDVGYIFNNRKEFEAHEDSPTEEALLNMNLNTLSYNAKWISAETKNRWNWIIGSQGMVQTNKNKGEEVLVPDATTIDFGLYTTADYHYTAHSYWQAGVRLDGRTIDGTSHGVPTEEGSIPAFDHTYTAYNFSTGIFQQLPRNFSLRASISSGFRAPNMFELLSNGVHEGTNRYEIGDQNLKTENSYQADVSLNYQTEHFSFFVNPYFNYIKNYIFLQPTEEIREDVSVYYYRQTDAYLYGGETGIHFHPHPFDWLHIQASYANTYGEDTDKNKIPLMPSSKINSIVNANFSGKKAVEKFSVFLQYQYAFKQDRIAAYETPTDAYSLVNAGLHFGFKVNAFRINVDVAANNIFDKCYYDHLSRYKSEGIYNIGRNFVFKCTIPI